MSREAHVRFCESPEVRILRATHPYIRTREGWLYLAVVLDLFSRRVIGWSMSHRLESRIVLDALQMAVDQRRPLGLVLAHSDRGVQYASDAVQRFYQRNGMTCSMSRKGNCWDTSLKQRLLNLCGPLDATLERMLAQ